MGGVLWLFVQLATDPTQEKLGPIRFCMLSKSVLLQLHWFPLRHSSTKLHYCSVLISSAGKGRHSPERCGSYTSATRAAARRILSCTARCLAAFCSALTKSALAMYASLAHGAREPTRRLGLRDVVNSDSRCV